MSGDHEPNNEPDTWGGIQCPVCRRVAYHRNMPDPHLKGCPIGVLEARVEALEVRCKSLLQLVKCLDDRTIGSAKIGGR